MGESVHEFGEKKRTTKKATPPGGVPAIDRSIPFAADPQGGDKPSKSLLGIARPGKKTYHDPGYGP
jgi:hypothetical protein